MAKFQISWTEEYWFKATIEADTEQEAMDIWQDNAYPSAGKLEPYGFEIQDNVDIIKQEEN